MFDWLSIFKMRISKAKLYQNRTFIRVLSFTTSDIRTCTSSKANLQETSKFIRELAQTCATESYSIPIRCTFYNNELTVAVRVKSGCLPSKGHLERKIGNKLAHLLSLSRLLLAAVLYIKISAEIG